MKLISRFAITDSNGVEYIRVLLCPVGEADDHESIHQRFLIGVIQDAGEHKVDDLGYEVVNE